MNDASAKKTNVALSSMLASLFLAVAKLVIGLLSGSLAILSEAAHALLDTGAATLTWLAVSVSDRPADETHHFGHGKVENLAALFETGLLFATSAWILWEAGQRLFGDGGHEVVVTWYALGIIVLSMVIDFTRARALRKVARETGSQALEADALHFTTDILSSGVVLVGLALSTVWPGADAVAAIGVAIFVIYAGLSLGKRTIDVLIEAAPEGAMEELTRIAEAVPGVVRVKRVRARLVGATTVAEVEVIVSRSMSVDRIEALRREIAWTIREGMGRVDPTVVAVPQSLSDESLFETVRAVANRFELPAHGLHLYRLGEVVHVGFDVEVDGHLSIDQAHRRVTELEHTLEENLAGAVRIDVHIDPIHEGIAESHPVGAEHKKLVRAILDGAVTQHPEIEGIHELHVLESDEGLRVRFHCLFRPDTSVERVHDVTRRLEAALYYHEPRVRSVVIHPEPSGALHGLHHAEAVEARSAASTEDTEEQ